MKSDFLFFATKSGKEFSKCKDSIQKFIDKVPTYDFENFIEKLKSN